MATPLEINKFAFEDAAACGEHTIHVVLRMRLTENWDWDFLKMQSNCSRSDAKPIFKYGNRTMK